MLHVGDARWRAPAFFPGFSGLGQEILPGRSGYANASENAAKQMRSASLNGGNDVRNCRLHWWRSRTSWLLFLNAVRRDCQSWMRSSATNFLLCSQMIVSVTAFKTANTIQKTRAFSISFANAIEKMCDVCRSLIKISVVRSGGCFFSTAANSLNFLALLIARDENSPRPKPKPAAMATTMFEILKAARFRRRDFN